MNRPRILAPIALLGALIAFAAASSISAQPAPATNPPANPPSANRGAAPQPTPPPSGDRIMLWADGVKTPGQNDDFKPYLEPYILAEKTPARGAVIVMPGGGYRNRSAREAGGVADKFNQAGYHAFVLQYRVGPNRHPAMLLDVQRAVRLVRSRAAEFGILADKIAVCGFSAGGHLAASADVLYDMKIEETPDELAEKISARPDAAILCYPVINSGEYAHKGSFDSLIGPDAPAELKAKMSLENQVNDQTPPTFLWHTAADRVVPVQNSLLFAEALAKNRVPFELHVYPNGGHGMALAPGDPHVASWMPLACEWLAGMGWKEKK